MIEINRASSRKHVCSEKIFFLISRKLDLRINYKNNIRRMYFCSWMHIFAKCQPRRIVQISGNLTVKFTKKEAGCQKTFSTARMFFPLWEIQCVNADAVGKNWWEKSSAGTFISKTSQNEKLSWPIWLLVRDVADIQRMRTRVEQGRAGQEGR